MSRARLVDYCELVARALSWTIPDDHPIAGSRFRQEQVRSHAYRVVAEAPAPPVVAPPPAKRLAKRRAIASSR